MAKTNNPASDNTILDGLIHFIDESPTPFHASASVCETLGDAGFSRLAAENRWDTKPGGSYVLPVGGGAVFAIRRHERRVSESGVVVLAAHTDSPALKLKERGAKRSKGYLTIPTELYGSPIHSTWFDRPLGLAGRAVLSDGTSRLFSLPFRAVVPNLALHLNRKANEGATYNTHDHFLSIIDSDQTKTDGDAREELMGLVSEATGSTWVEEIDLFLHDPTTTELIGEDSRLLNGPRLDNLAGCYANIQAFLRAEPARTAVVALFNHEETGSKSGEGAESDFLSSIVKRLVIAEGGDAEDAMVAAARSLIVSNDAAHALHPAHASSYDPNYSPVLNGGPAVKLHGMYKYASTPATTAMFARACAAADVPMQRLANRSDMRAGSTVGPITWARTGMPAVDVGVPVFAMHSVRETAGALDTAMMISALTAVLEASE